MYREVGHRYALHEVERILDWPSTLELAEILGVPVTTVEGWKARGLSHTQADEIATRFNHHGVELWGQVFLDAPTYPPGTNVKPERIRPTSGIGAISPNCWKGKGKVDS